MRRLLLPTRLPPVVKWTALAGGLLVAVGCGASGAATSVAEGGSLSSDAGGSTGTGGLPTDGGASQVSTSIGNGGTGGGSNSAGGNRGTGGIPISTGGKANGGALSTGGARPTGGNNATGTGGNRVTTGGLPATGGVRSTTGGSPVTGGTTATSTLNPPITGSNGHATRYWDCCKPSCSWTTAVPSCQKDGATRITDRNATSGCDSGGTAFECFDFSPWYDASTNLSYGFVAYNAASCGACYQLQFTGTSQYGVNNGAINIKGKQMIVQVINIGNISAGQFDLLVPGGGVGAMTAGCTAQWGSSADLGATYGGLLTECNLDPTCMQNKCQSVFGSFPKLLAGCNWFTGWYSSADNPQVIYKQVSCPSQITSKSGISG